MFGAVLIHTGTILTNDYFDHRSGCDERNKTPTPFSGGSRVIQEHLIPARQILWAALFSFFAGGAIGLYLNAVSQGNIILVFGVIGIFLGYFYTASPLKIGYGSLGELAVGFGFGPLVTMGAYYVQAQVLPLKIFFISIPVGILITLVLLINEFPDYCADKSVSKRTWVVILGKKSAVVLYQILWATVYLSILLLVAFRFLPFICLIVLSSFPFTLKAVIISHKNFDKIYELLPANAVTIGLHALMGVLLCAGFILDKFL
jgi:1,4-dihydroxy-2-naphthoate octaprenyltransferase